MPVTGEQQLTITLPIEVAEAVKAKVASGEFNTEGDVLSASFLNFVDDRHDLKLGLADDAFDEMLRREVLPVLDELEADPSSELGIERVRAHLAERRAR